MQGSQPRVRIYLIFGVLAAFAVVLAGKLYLVQVVHGEQYSDRADQQYVRPNYNLYNRGDIQFRGKDGGLVPAATLKTGFTVAINPEEMDQPNRVYEKLSEHLELDRESFLQQANRSDDPYEEIAKRVDAATANALQERAIASVNVYKQKWRYYPGDTMAARTIGFVAYKGDERAGRYGLERFYNDVLERDNDQLYVNFFAEVFSNIKDTLFTNAKRQGDVITGLEPNAQAFLQRRLADLNETWESKLSGGIVMDPETGRILAMATEPGFNPNELSDVSSSAVFSNPLVENVYEMGSIIKPITMAIGLDTGAVTPETTYTDTGSLTLNGETIRNYDGEARGKVAMQEVLNQSLNTGAAFVAMETGQQTFADRMRAFGVGEKTGIDLPNEATGIISNLKSPREIELATASFGQGIAMSPIATVRALAALANGGRLVTPHVATEIRYELGGTKSVAPDTGARVLASSTSETITRMLVDVVDEALKNGDVAMENYSIAAKTGTAQVAKEAARGYYRDRFLHSFFGYAPAYQPRFLVFLYTTEPGAKYASQTLTEPFMDITKFLINYYEVPPDR